MTATLSETASALLAACAADPAEDSHRLVLADALQESGEPVLEAWAEYIRAAVEMERIDLGGPPMCRAAKSGTWGASPPGHDRHCDYCIWHALERPVAQRRHVELCRLTSTLLATHGREWARGPCCEECGGRPRTNYGLPSGEFYCPTCHGTGYTGPLSLVPFEDIGWRRGLPYSVRMPLAEWGWEEVRSRPRRGATVTAMPNEELRRWLPSPWSLDLLRAWPVEECGVSDKEPFNWHERWRSLGTYDSFPDNVPWGWCTASDSPERSLLPQSLYAEVVKLGTGPLGRSSGNGWPSAAAANTANTALARALAKLTREKLTPATNQEDTCRK